VLVIQGEDDPYGTRAQVDAIARQVRGPVDVVMLPQCGHAPHRDQPEATLEAIVRFAKRETRD
jgi:pimeloyl-ACP methyl ester carboxylesterase